MPRKRFRFRLALWPEIFLKFWVEALVHTFARPCYLCIRAAKVAYTLNKIRLGIQEVMPMNVSDMCVGLQVDVNRLCAGAVL